MGPEGQLDWLHEDAAADFAPAYEVVAQRLKRAIHLGQLAPGSKLPAERTFSAQLGISRVTLREAIRILEGEGYIEVGRGSRGGSVVHSGAMKPAEVRSWMRKRWDDLEAILDFRLAVERSGAERAADRVTRKQIAELRTLVEEGRESADVNAFRTADVRFHMKIAELARSSLLLRAVEEARAELYVPFRAISLEDMRETSVPQHAAIVDALEQGDGQAAGETMATHLSTTVDEMRHLAGRS
jgi:GntR family transcriptional regulator, transcriptional repressor for pyruvate dehydrogenase complex